MGHRYDAMLDEIMENNNGVITTAQAQAVGVTRPTFASYTKRRGLERQSRGVYLDPDTFPDDLALLHIRFPGAVYSHGTALYLHDMTDRYPFQYEVTVKSSYNASSLRRKGLHVYFCQPEWYGLGIMELKTPSGNLVKVYDKDRTVCDIVRRRDKIDPAAFRQAIQCYVRSKDKNLIKLGAYADRMGLSKAVYDIMEVAL